MAEIIRAKPVAHRLERLKTHDLLQAMRRAIEASPMLGEPTEEVLRAAGFSEAERVALTGCGAVRQAA